MSRLPSLSPDNMTDEQRRVYEGIASGPRGGVRGPFHFWLRSPELAESGQKLGGFLRFRSQLPAKLREFAILLTARFWTAQYVWHAHRPMAEKAGLAGKIIEAVATRQLPAGMDTDEAAVYGVASELLDKKSVSDATYRTALDQLGEQTLVELVGLIGYYCLTSTTVNTFQMDLPEGVAPPLAD